VSPAIKNLLLSNSVRRYFVCPNGLTQTAHQTLHTNCPNCQASICLACLKNACQKSCTSPDGCGNVSHCSRARSILLLRILASLDRIYISERRNEKARDQNTPRTQKPQGAGTGYTNPFQDIAKEKFTSESAVQRSAAISQQRDLQFTSIFRGISWILKGSNMEVGLLNLLIISTFGQVVSELIRNDSISDYSERVELYGMLLTALEVISTNPQLIQFYISKRLEVESRDGLEYILAGLGNLIGKKDARGDQETLPPLLELLDNLTKQAETFTRTSGHIRSKDIPFKNAINLATRIIRLSQHIHSMSIEAPEPSAPSTHEEAYAKACSDLVYDEYPATSNVPFHFQSETTSIWRFRSPNPKRTITLAKELSTMATSLPPGIFVRNLANRPDCIKALIAGPPGTPFYGGLFEFDIWAPNEYPNVPPKVRLRNNGNGQADYNPNLHP
jgi:Ubiquitin-conjugating enzyme